MVNSLLSSARLMDVQQITHALYALSRLECKWTDLTEANRRTLCSEVGRIYAADLTGSSNGRDHSRNVTTLIYALGSLGASWSEMTDDVTVPLLQTLERATAGERGAESVLRDREIAGLIFGLGRLGLRWSTLSPGLRASLQRDLSHPSLLARGLPSDVVLLVWGLGQMGAPLSVLHPQANETPAASLPLLLEAIQQHEFSFTAEEVPLLLRGVALLGLSWEGMKASLKSCIARLVSSNLRDFNNQELGEVMQALTLLCFDYARDTVRVRNFNSLNRQVLDTLQPRTSLSLDRRQALQLIHYLDTMELFTFDTQPIANDILGTSNQWTNVSAASSASAAGLVAHGGFNFTLSCDHTQRHPVVTQFIDTLSASLDKALHKVRRCFQGHPLGGAFPPMDCAVIERRTGHVLLFIDLHSDDDHYCSPPSSYSASSSSASVPAGHLVRPLQLKDSLYLNRFKGSAVRHFSESRMAADPLEIKRCVDKIVNICKNSNNHKK